MEVRRVQLFLFSFFRSLAQFSHRQAWTMFLSSTWNTDPWGGLMHECVFAWHVYCFTESVFLHLKKRSLTQCSFPAAQPTETSVCESFCTIDSWTHPNKTFKESHFTVPFQNVACVVNLFGLVFFQLSSSWLVWGQQEPDREPTEHISHADSLYCGMCLCLYALSLFLIFWVPKNICFVPENHHVCMHVQRLCVSACLRVLC